MDTPSPFCSINIMSQQTDHEALAACMDPLPFESIESTKVNAAKNSSKRRKSSFAVGRKRKSLSYSTNTDFHTSLPEGLAQTCRLRMLTETCFAHARKEWEKENDLTGELSGHVENCLEQFFEQAEWVLGTMKERKPNTINENYKSLYALYSTERDRLLEEKQLWDQLSTATRSSSTSNQRSSVTNPFPYEPTDKSLTDIEQSLVLKVKQIEKTFQAIQLLQTNASLYTKRTSSTTQIPPTSNGDDITDETPRRIINRLNII